MISQSAYLATKPTIIVCGATGFIGQRFIRQLNQYGVRAIVISRQKRPTDYSAENWIHLTGDEIKLPKADAIVNLAGKAHAMREILPDCDEYNYVNSTLPILLSEAGLRAGIKRFIHISTVKVWSDATVARLNKIGKIVDASVEPDADTIYGQSKLSAESKLRKVEGLELMVLRLSMVYGPDNKGNLPKLIHAAKSRFFPGLPRSCGLRSMVHVDDVIDAIVLSLATKSVGATPLTITSADSFGADTICDWVRDEVGLKPRVFRTPAFVWRMIGVIGSLAEAVFRKKMPINNEAIDRLLSPYIVDASFAREALGFVAKRRLEDFVRKSAHNK